MSIDILCATHYRFNRLDSGGAELSSSDNAFLISCNWTLIMCYNLNELARFFCSHTRAYLWKWVSFSNTNIAFWKSIQLNMLDMHWFAQFRSKNQVFFQIHLKFYILNVIQWMRSNTKWWMKGYDSSVFYSMRAERFSTLINISK